MSLANWLTSSRASGFRSTYGHSTGRARRLTHRMLCPYPGEFLLRREGWGGCGSHTRPEDVTIRAPACAGRPPGACPRGLTISPAGYLKGGGCVFCTSLRPRTRLVGNVPASLGAGGAFSASRLFLSGLFGQFPHGFFDSAFCLATSPCTPQSQSGQGRPEQTGYEYGKCAKVLTDSQRP